MDFTYNLTNSISNNGFIECIPLKACIDQCQESCKSHLFEVAINNYLMFVVFAAVLMAFVVVASSLKHKVLEKTDMVLSEIRLKVPFMLRDRVVFDEFVYDQMLFYMQVGAIILLTVFFFLFKLKIEILSGVK